VAFWSKPWWGNVTAFIGNLLGIGRVPAEGDETGVEELRAEMARQEAARRQQTTNILIGVGVVAGVLAIVVFFSRKKR